MAPVETTGKRSELGVIAASLREHWDHALLFRVLATLRTDAPIDLSVDELEWRGPRNLS